MYALAFSKLLNISNFAVGRLCRRIKFLENAFDHSSFAASLVGPQIRKPCFVNSSTMPSASWSSGSARVKSIFSFLANSKSPFISVAFISTFTPIFSVPAFPGAKKSCPARGDCATFHPTACSLPPLPMIKIFCLLSIGIVFLLLPHTNHSPFSLVLHIKILHYHQH